MALKKNELYASLWASCDELRGGMDASLYKDYVLTLLFLKYISDKSGSKNAIIELPDGTYFNDIIKLKNTTEIGDNLNKIIAKIAEANDLKGVIDVADFNNEDKLGKGKEMVERLSNLVGIFEGLDMSANGVEGDDLLGDAYEYLMRHFATESGKSKGQFYTPAEVSRIMAKIIGIDESSTSNTTVYDPTCGSGSLLLKAVSQAGNTLSVYGQEKDVATASLAIMNMILHNNETAEIRTGNTLSAPAFLDNGKLKTFDFAVANPPFSSKNWTNGLNPSDDPFDRFAYGIPPEKNGDYAFLLHLLKSLKSTGKGAIILPHGVLFRGNAESTIRQELLKQGVIKGIIGLPANLFYGTGIPACIIVIDKEHAQIAQFADNDHRQIVSGRPIFMIDASNDFIKDGNKNRLRERDIHKIVDTFVNQKTIAHYSRLVPLQEIAEQDYNLNLPRYIDSGKVDDIQDLEAHLYGGIPVADIDELAEFWQVFDGLKEELFELKGKRYHAKQPAEQIKAHILAHPTYQNFVASALNRFKNWQKDNDLSQINIKDRPKALIEQWSESLLSHFSDSLLIENYGIYQILMDYWATNLQDDVYFIIGEGWSLNDKLLRQIIIKKDKDGKKQKSEPHDFIINKIKYKAELIPPTLVAKRFFAENLANLTACQNELERINQEMESLLEEHSTEEGVLKEIGNKKENELLLNSYYEMAWQKCDLTEYSKFIHLHKELTDTTSQLDILSGQIVFADFKGKNGKVSKSAVSKALKTTHLNHSDLKQYMILQEKITQLKDKIKEQEQIFAQFKEQFAESEQNMPYQDEISIICQYVQLSEQEKQAKDALKVASETLDLAIFKRYGTLSVDEIKTLVVEDKWLATLESQIQSQIERAVQGFITRLATLENRYQSPLSVLTDEVTHWESKVNEHLKTMGLL